MSTNKNAIIRYRTLDKCFRNTGRRYDINTLLEECNKALLEFDPNLEGIKKRQLYDDIRFMESEQGWSVPIAKEKEGRVVFYSYEDPNFTINNKSVNAIEATEIKSALMVLSRFQGLPQFSWVDEMIPKINQEFGFTNNKKIMSFQDNEFFTGANHISTLFNAIQNHQPLQITYRSYKSDKPKTFDISPYLLKQYNNRWFLFCKDPSFQSLTNLALDRILLIKESSISYESIEIDFDEYFDDFIGVSKNKENAFQKITLRAFGRAPDYIKSKPFHSSQKRIQETDEFYDFSIEVIPNYELESTILSFGESLVVLEPESLRKKIAARLSILIKNY